MRFERNELGREAPVWIIALNRPARMDAISQPMRPGCLTSMPRPKVRLERGRLPDAIRSASPLPLGGTGKPDRQFPCRQIVARGQTG